MARLWLNNLPPNFGEDDIAALLEKYGFPPFDHLEQMPENAQGRAAVLSFDEIDEELLQRLQPRVNNLYVDGQTIRVLVAPPQRPEPR
ncbi:MAG: RNA recognition motif domain-containing protein [Betaproteobacteria bacterium]